MLENYIDIQPVITKLLLNSFDNNKLVQAYLLVLNDKNFLMDYSLAFAKKIISDNDEKINNMIDNNNYPELKIINPINDVIKKESLQQLQKSFLVKPTLGKKLVYIINEADKFNSSSANTILKFLEEPNEDIVAILLTTNLSKVLPTIKSRCQILMLKSENIKEERSLEKYYNEYSKNKDLSEFTLDYFKNLLDKTIKNIKLLEKIKINMFFHFKQDIFEVFKNKDELIIMFDFMLYFYYDSLNYILKRNIIYLKDYAEDIEEISNKNNIDFIKKKIQIIEEEKLKLNSNMNNKLLMDEFIINFSEV